MHISDVLIVAEQISVKFGMQESQAGYKRQINLY